MELIEEVNVKIIIKHNILYAMGNLSVMFYVAKMASDKPASVEHDKSDLSIDLEESLLSMENLDRSSPELWPEKIPGISEFMSSFTPPNVIKLPYSREFTIEDQNYLHQLASLSTGGLIAKVKELHDIAYKLGVEESKEVTKGKYLNIFSKSNKYK